MCYSAHKYDCGHLGRKNKIQCQRMSKLRAFIGRVLYDEQCRHVIPKRRHKLCRACESNSEPSTNSENDLAEPRRNHGRKTRRYEEASGSAKKERHRHRGEEPKVSSSRKEAQKSSSRNGSERSHGSRETKRSQQSKKSGSSGQSRKNESKVKETQAPRRQAPLEHVPVPQPGNESTVSTSSDQTIWPGLYSQQQQARNNTNAWLQSVENMSAVPEPLVTPGARARNAAVRYPAAPPPRASFQRPTVPAPTTPAYDPRTDPTYAPRPVSSFYSSDGGPPGSILPGETEAKPRSEYLTVYLDTEIGPCTRFNSPPPPPIPPKSRWRNLTPSAGASGTQQAGPSRASGAMENEANEYVPARSQWRKPTGPGQSRYAGLPGTTSEYIAHSKRPEEKADPVKETVPSMYAEYYATIDNPYLSFSSRKARKQPEVSRPPNINLQPPMNRASVNPSSSRRPVPSPAEQPSFNRSQSAPDPPTIRWSTVVTPHGNGIKHTPSTSGSQIFMNPRAAPRPPRIQVSVPENTNNLHQVHTVNPRIVKESWGDRSGPSSGKKSQQGSWGDAPSKSPLNFGQFGRDLRDKIKTLRKEPSEASFACQDARAHDAKFAPPPTPAKRGFFRKLSGSK